MPKRSAYLTLRRRREARNGRLLVAPLVLGCLFFVVVPFLIVVVYSFTLGQGGGANYLALTKSSVFRLALWNTFRFLAVGLALILLISYLIALMLKKYVSRFALLKSVLLFPYVMPVVGTLVLVELIFSYRGLVSQGLHLLLGLPLSDWLSSPAAFIAALVLYLWKNTGYSVILLLSGLGTIPEECYDAAAVDGATAFQRWRYITAPQMWYCVFFTLIFSLINAFKCFREIFLLGGTHPHTSIYMLQHFINNCFQNLNVARLSAASILLLLVLAVIFLLFYLFVKRKEAFRE